MAVLQSIIDPVYGSGSHVRWKDGPGYDSRPINADALNAFDDNIKLAQLAINELFDTLYKEDSKFENSGRDTDDKKAEFDEPTSRITYIINSLIGSDLLTASGLPDNVQTTITNQLIKAKSLIDDESTRATTAESTLQANITAEANSRAVEDNHIKDELIGNFSLVGLPDGATVLHKIQALFSKINDEISRAQSAESTITSNLASEISRATTAEQTITNNLQTESTRATTAETNLSDRIDSTQESIENLSGTVSNNKSAYDNYVSETNVSIEGINQKNSEQDTRLTNLTTRATQAESDIAELQNKLGTTGNVTSSINEAKELAQNAQNAAATAQSEVDSLEEVVYENNTRAQISYTEATLPEGTISNLIGVLKQGNTEIEIKVPTAAAAPLYWVEF